MDIYGKYSGWTLVKCPNDRALQEISHNNGKTGVRTKISLIFEKSLTKYIKYDNKSFNRIGVKDALRGDQDQVLPFALIKNKARPPI